MMLLVEVMINNLKKCQCFRCVKWNLDPASLDWFCEIVQEPMVSRKRKMMFFAYTMCSFPSSNTSGADWVCLLLVQ
jgi:hypothetical protein